MASSPTDRLLAATTSDERSPGDVTRRIRPTGCAARTAAIMMAMAAVTHSQAARAVRPAFDVRDYAITLDLPDTGAAIHAVAVLTVARQSDADTLVLDLLDLGVNGVTVDGHAAPFLRTTRSIAIALPRRGRRGATYVVSVDYGGTVTDGLIVRTDSAGRWTYFGDNFPDRARRWIAGIDDPSDKATVTWRVRAPVGRTVVANGKLVATRSLHDQSGADRVEWEWRESRPIPTYLMVIAAAPLEQFDLGDTACGLAELQRCVPQSVYTAPELKNTMPGPFSRAPQIVQFFARMVGPFPYEKLAHVQSSTRFGGMENASTIFYADAGFRRQTMTDDIIAHETAHQWFGDAVTESQWAHLWLSEGFATYFAALWNRAARGDSAFRLQMSAMRQTVLADTIAVTKRPVIDTAETNYLALLNHNSYEKGGFILQMLRASIGERAFFDGLRSYYAKHRHSTALTDDLQSELEGSSKAKLGWFFDQWLRRPGYPEVAARWSYYAATHEVVISVTQSSRFGPFQFPLTVEVVDSAGVAHRGEVQVAARAGAMQQLRLPAEGRPLRVSLDPDVELLASMTVVEQ
jgi:aminopeptidase N